MTTPSDVLATEALREAEQTACVLEGLQALREGDARAALEARRSQASLWRDAQSARLRAAMDKLARLQATTRAHRATLATAPHEPGAITLLRTWWRGLLVAAWLLALLNQYDWPFTRALVPVAALWLVMLLNLSWRRP